MQKNRIDQKDEDTPDVPEQAPNFLTADELQAREPAKREVRRENEKPVDKPAPR